MKRCLSLCLASFFLAGVAAADLKVVSEVESTGMGAMADGRTTTYLQGMKMRVEPDKGETMILDIDKQQMILLFPKKNRAEVYNLAPLAQQQVAIETQEVSLEATGNTREVAGYTCEDHNMSLTIAAGAQGMDMDISMKGPVCLSKKAPGSDEFFAFYKAMAEKGLFLGPPQAAQSQPGRERGMTQLYRTMAEKGIGLESELSVSFEGSGMMAKMMKRLGTTSTTKVLEISDTTLSSDLFEVPASYKVKNK